MFTLIKPDTKINFVGIRRIAYAFSALAIVISLLSVLLQGGLRYGIDFAGGAVMQVKFEKPIADETLKTSLADAGLEGLTIQSYGDGNHEYLIRVAVDSLAPDVIRDGINSALIKNLPDAAYIVERMEMVGPKVGADLRSKAIEALYYAVLLIAVYISGRFEQRWMSAGIMAAVLWGGMYGLTSLGMPQEWLVIAAMAVTIVLCWKLKLHFALGAIIALLHDVIIAVGLLSVLGKEFDLNIIAALLTVIGYSLNDTIIVYDRIRENLRAHDELSFAEVINLSVNQTLSRTVLTGGTTLLVILSLFFLGGGVIHDFALTMFCGVFVGTLSSIFVASPVLLAFGKPENYIQVEEEYEKPGEHGMV